VYALGNAREISASAFGIHLLVAQLSWREEFKEEI
jgi:hypothetical protein